MSPATFFRKPWIFVTILALIAAAVMVRLGIWQLDRLEGRRDFNAQVLSQINEPTLPLTGDVLASDLEALEFRTVQATGQYDEAHILVLGNQVYGEQIGVHLLTPLQIEGTGERILIDRGWIPFEDWQNKSLAQYAEPGIVTIEGMLRVSQSRVGLRDCLDESVGVFPFQVWCLDLEGISSFLPYNLQPVYLIQSPADAQSAPPYRQIPAIEISEGPHLSYAIQWFSFAAILLIGYPFFVRREMQARQKMQNDE